jgi:glycosyltransferase involved in cell wall biosynthesis
VIPIKVVLLTPFYKPIKGGVTTFVENLNEGLFKNSVTVNIITAKGEPNSNTEVLGSNKYATILKAVLKLRKKKPDVLHSHSNWSLMMPCVWYKKLHPNTQLIHTFHTEPVTRPGKLKKKIYQYLFSKYDIITFVSLDLKNKFEDIFDFKTENIVVYSGVALEKFTQKEKQQFITMYNLEDNFPILSFVGPLSWKMKVEGVKRLIAATKILKKDYPDVKLLIVGDGAYQKELKEYTENNNLSKEVIFTGFLDKSSIPLSTSHIYTHISLQEGLPIALLEAMCLGKPVIAAKTGGIPEVINDGQNGILVEAKPEEIADKIVNLCKNTKKMDELGRNAQETVKKEHDWEKVTQKFLDLYLGK